MENNNKTPHCPECTVPDEAIEKLKKSGAEMEARHESKKEKREEERIAQINAKKTRKFFTWIAVAALATGLIFGAIKLSAFFAEKQTNAPKITAYYSNTCGCCKQWIAYMKGNGFNVEAIATDDLISIKDQYNVPEGLQGCHTSVIDGYVVEGMVPFQAINKMIAEKPDISGIALPGMPHTAPGMPGYNGSYLKVFSLSNGASSEYQY